MRGPHIRPEPGPRLVELIAIRKRMYPGMFQRDFAAKFLGISRLHMSAIEIGRRPPSLELAIRWIEALKPEAKLSMFGPMPLVEERIRALKRLQKIAPDYVKAA